MANGKGQGAENPFETMFELWSQGAVAYAQAANTFYTTAMTTAQKVLAESADDPTRAAQRTLDSWAQMASKMFTFQPGLVEDLLADLPRKAGERLNAQTFSLLGRMAAARWNEDLRRISEIPIEVAERAAGTDREGLKELFESMMAEYLCDLKAIGAMGGRVNLDHLARAWGKVVAGDADEGAQRTIENFFKAMVTKAQYGGEYYADPDATRVGQTPREKVHSAGKISLYRYTAATDEPRRGDPVLIVYSIINRPYILDLIPGYSMIEHMLEQGLDVYLIDWGETEAGDRWTTLDSYIDPGIRSCVTKIKELTGAQRVSLFGHCIGGNLALLYAALFPDDVSRLLTLTTPITAARGGVVALWTNRDIFPVDAIIDTYGHMPAKLIRYTFMSLKPYYEVLKWKMFLEQLHDERVMRLFYAIDRWANDNVDLPGEVFRKFVVEVFHEDRFSKGRTRINGKIADLKQVTCPVYNLTATKDWIVPPESANMLADLVGSDETYYTNLDGAHVSLLIEPRTRGHWTDMSDFFLGNQPGSTKQAE